MLMKNLKLFKNVFFQLHLNLIKKELIDVYYINSNKNTNVFFLTKIFK